MLKKFVSLVAKEGKETVVIETLEDSEANRSALHEKRVADIIENATRPLREDPKMSITTFDPREDRPANRAERRRWEKWMRKAMNKMQKRLTKEQIGRQNMVDAALADEFAKREESMVLPRGWRTKRSEGGGR